MSSTPRGPASTRTSTRSARPSRRTLCRRGYPCKKGDARFGINARCGLVGVPPVPAVDLRDAKRRDSDERSQEDGEGPVHPPRTLERRALAVAMVPFPRASLRIGPRAKIDGDYPQRTGCVNPILAGSRSRLSVRRVCSRAPTSRARLEFLMGRLLIGSVA